VSGWLPAAVAVPLAGGCAALLLPRHAARVGTATALATAAAAAGVVAGVWTGGVRRHPLGGWGAPLGIDLRADGLAALMLAAVAVGACGVALYATAYFEDEDAEQGVPASYWTLALFLWGGSTRSSSPPTSSTSTWRWS
jgi:multicomponent Na+:H+ antiporter subunit D